MTTDVIKQIRRATRRRFTAEEKIRIVLEGLRGEIPVTELCRKEGIQPSIYYKWSKAFLDSGKNGLTRETSRDATSGEVRRLKGENEALKKAVAEMVLEKPSHRVIGLTLNIYFMDFHVTGKPSRKRVVFAKAY